MELGPKHRSSSTIFVLITAMVVDLLAFTCILPLYPALLDFYSLEEHRDWLYDKFVSNTKIFQDFIGVTNSVQFHFVFLGGFIGSLFSGLQFLSSPLLGALSDVYGRKLLLLVSVFGTLLSYLIWSRATTFTLFVLSRIVGGLSKASVSISTAVISDVYTPDVIAKGMALIGVAFSIGFVIGPMLGAYFSHYAKNNLGYHLFYTTPAYFASALTILELIIILFFFKETLQPNLRKTKLSDVIERCSIYLTPRSLFAFEAVKSSMKKSDVGKMKTYGLAYFIYLFLYSGMEFTVSFLTRIRFHYDSMQQGKMYLYVGIVMILMQGGFVRRISSSKHLQFALFGIAAIIPAYIIIGLSQNVWLFYLGLTLYAVSSGIVVPCITSCVSNLSPLHSKGATLGVFRSLGALARALGPLVSSTIFWLAGPETCYLIGGISLAIPILFLRRISVPQHKAKLQ